LGVEQKKKNDLQQQTTQEERPWLDTRFVSSNHTVVRDHILNEGKTRKHTAELSLIAASVIPLISLLSEMFTLQNTYRGMISLLSHRYILNVN
jgi:hypothetical protein